MSSFQEPVVYLTAAVQLFRKLSKTSGASLDLHATDLFSSVLFLLFLFETVFLGTVMGCIFVYVIVYFWRKIYLCQYHVNGGETIKETTISICNVSKVTMTSACVCVCVCVRTGVSSSAWKLIAVHPSASSLYQFFRRSQC